MDSESIITTREFIHAPDIAGFRQVSGPDAAPPIEPAFMLGSVPDDVMAAYRKHTHIHPIGVLGIAGELRHPYLLTHRGQPVAAAWCNMHAPHLRDMWRGDDWPHRNIGGGVLVAGPGYPIFGHWLVDFLPKLWILHAAGYDLAALNYIVPYDAKPWARELLRMLGITRLIELRPGETLTGHFLLPTTIHNGVRGPMFGDAAAWLRDRLGLRVQNSNVRLFLSRATAPQTRPLLNREAVERVAVDAGYSIVSPERLSLGEQFRLVASASRVAGECGSQLHLTLFAGRGMRVCGLRGSEFHPSFIQSAIGAACGQPTGYVFGRTEADRARSFVVDLDAAREGLHRQNAGM